MTVIKVVCTKENPITPEHLDDMANLNYKRFRWEVVHENAYKTGETCTGCDYFFCSNCNQKWLEETNEPY